MDSPASLAERAVRAFALVVVASTFLGAFCGMIGVVRASDGSLLPLHSDYAVDIDIPPDGLFDELVVNVTIDVTVNGLFYVTGELYDTSGTALIESRFVAVGLDAGVRTAQLVFTGYLIQASGFNGPYQVDIALLDDKFLLLDVDTHTTNPYFAASFQLLPAYLSPPHLDFGLDSDADSLFDYLITSVKIDVNVSGVYRVEGALYEPGGVFPITSGSNETLLGVGTHTVDIAFIGYAIRASGIDGPYQVELELLEESSSLLTNGTYFTNAHSSDSFEQPPATFVPPHSDRGVDLNGNSIFEYLVVTTSVAVFSDGTYYVEGITSFGSAKNITNLTTGIQSVDLWFIGFEIRKAGSSGRHSVDITVRDEFLNLLDYEVYNTTAYSENEFELNPPCTFSSPHRERGIDADGDSQYDILMITANVTVDAPGFYEVRAELLNSVGTTLITSAESSRLLGAGKQSLVLSFDGITIFHSSLDGPYDVALALYDEMDFLLDNDVFATQPYPHTDFEMPPAVLDPLHTDYGLDTDIPPNGLFNFLVADASIRVKDSGWYSLYCTLMDSYFNPITTAQKFTFLFAGPVSLSLRFNGMNISRSGVDGPYVVYMDLYFFSGQTPIYADWDLYITNPYNHTDFMAPVNANIWGFVYKASDGSPVEEAQITAVNYTYGWISQTESNATGYYEIKAFDGDFCVLVDSRDLQANITCSSVTGSTEITRYIEDSVPNVVVENLVLSDWDNIAYDMRAEIKTDNKSTRFMIDLLVGNKDGYVDQTELNIMALFLAVSAPPPPSNTVDLFYVDGIHFDLVPGSYSLNLEALGPVTSPEPSFMTVFTNYTSNSTISASSTHWLELNMTYDSNEETIVHNSQLPPGFNLWGYLPANNVTVTGVGSQNVMTDPLMDWDPFDANDSVWVNLTVGQGVPDVEPPQVLNVLLNDMDSPTYGLSEIPSVVYFNATIDDTGVGNVPIGGANYTVGVQNWSGSMPMNPADGSFDSVSEDVTVMIVPQSVTTTYCVYGWDSLLNNNTAGSCMSLVVLDDMAPEIHNVVVSPATFFLSSAPPTTTLTATIDDRTTGSSVVSGANYTIPSIDSWPGTSMIAGDGAFDEPVEDVAANVPLPTSAGAFYIYIHAWDANNERNDSAPSIQITIIDDVAPATVDPRLNGQTTLVVSAGTSVLLNATIDDTRGQGDTSIQGANYTIDGDWATSTAMFAIDGSFDSATEVVNIIIDTSSWSDGTHQICVHGSDVVPNYNITFYACAQLTVQTSFDIQGPTMENETVEPSTQAPNELVRISVDVYDIAGVSNVSIRVLDPDGQLVGNYTMDYDSINEEYYYSDSYTEIGSYTYTMWASDTGGNWNSVSGNFEIGNIEAAPFFLVEYWWILVILIIAVITSILVFRKLKVAGPPSTPAEEVASEEGAESSLVGEAEDEPPVMAKEVLEMENTIKCLQCGDTVLLVGDTNLLKTRCEHCGSTLLDISPGFNYLIVDDDPSVAFQGFKTILKKEIPGLCVSTTFPEKLIKRYDVEGADLYWLTDTTADTKARTLDPKRLDFEMMRAITNFLKKSPEGVVMIDGVESLIVENGFDDVYRFLKNINDLASVGGATIFVSLAPSSLGKDELAVLQKEFDKVQILTSSKHPE